MNPRSKSKTPFAALSLALALVVGGDRLAAQGAGDARSAGQAAPIAAEVFPAGFTSATAQVNGTTLHYVTGGRGPALILLHGFPENWSAYAEIMPRLAARFRVVAVDLRGIGGSSPTESGYDSVNMAEDVHELTRTLELERPYVVGHDIGGIVAYALVRLHSDAVRGVMLVDAPIPGVAPWDEVKAHPGVWHIQFHTAPGLTEKLVAGREAIYFEYFLRGSAADPGTVSDEAIKRYARAYSGPGQMAAAMGMYRSFPAGETFGRERRGPLAVPIALVGGGVPDKGFATLLPALAKGLEEAGARSVAVETIAGAGHYVIDEKPAEVAALIERYASTSAARINPVNSGK